MSKRALISGCSGQDGSYLCELLLEKGYTVHGIVRRHSVAEHQSSRINHLGDRVTTHYGSVTDAGRLAEIVATVQPDEVYHLAAQSHVRVSSDAKQETLEINAVGALNMLDACRRHAKGCRYYQASSSEMFGRGVDPDGFQRLSTPFQPTSPYGVSKVAAFHLTKHFRAAYGMHATNGILFNHESPRRGTNFVTAKVVAGAVSIYRGHAKTLELGAMDSSRDWGHSKDYTKAMWMMLQRDDPSDWIVATGETRTVRELCLYTFGRLNLDYQDYVVQNPKFLRPEELPYLRGESSRIREELGWEPEYTFESMIDEVLQTWLERIPA